MLPKQLRLRQKSHFKTIFNAGNGFPGKHVVIYVMPGPRKFGFIASKKVGNAVIRNRARRLLREVVRLHLSDIREDRQIILIARSTLKGVSYQEVENSLLKLLKRAKVLRE